MKPERSAFSSRFLACRPKSDAAEQIRYPQSSLIKIIDLIRTQFCPNRFPEM